MGRNELPGDHLVASTETWRCSGLAFYAYSVFGTLFQLFPPLFDAIMAEFGVSRPAVSLMGTSAGFLTISPLTLAGLVLALTLKTR